MFLVICRIVEYRTLNVVLVIVCGLCAGGSSFFFVSNYFVDQTQLLNERERQREGKKIFNIERKIVSDRAV